MSTSSTILAAVTSLMGTPNPASAFCSSSFEMAPFVSLSSDLRHF